MTTLIDPSLADLDSPATADAERQRLHEIAAEIAAYQQLLGLSNVEMCRRYAGLGSDKTYWACVGQKTEQLNTARWLPTYEGVLNTIRYERAQEDEALFDDLPSVVAVRQTFIEVLNTTSNARVIIVEGESGVGKTFARLALMKNFAKRCLLVEACDAWRDKPGPLLEAILRELGDTNPPPSVSACLARAITLLSAPRRALLIEEAHHLGPVSLNTLKTLVNRTPGEFVLLCIPTLYRRMERAAYEEVRQLVGNRLAARLRLQPPGATEVETYLAHRLGKALALDAESRPGFRRLCQEIAVRAPRYGNYAFVRQIAVRARAGAAAGQPLTLAEITAAVRLEASNRG